MGERPEQMRDHLEATRYELGRNIGQLEDKVKRTFNWRSQFAERPLVSVGVAFGAGVLISSLIAPRSSAHRSLSDGPVAKKVSKEWENIKGAIVGVAATKFRSFLGDAIPGFEEHYKSAGGQENPIR
jgi:hypothetical protein